MIVRSLRSVMRRFPSLAVSAALLVAGCGYTSEYVAPRDGRVRAVWNESDVTADNGGAAGIEAGDCGLQMQWLVAGGTGVFTPASGRSYRHEPGHGHWRPVYYGEPIVIINPGFAPPLPTPHLFLPPSPSLSLFHAATSSGVHVSAPSLGGGGGNSKLGDALVYLLIIALIVMPIVDLALVIGPAESDKSATSIDWVNAWNDLLRTPGSACELALRGGQ